MPDRTARLAALLLFLAGCSALPGAGPPVVEANDNRVAAGTLKDGVLTIDLEIRMARWYPDAPDGPYADVPAFSVAGGAPQIPAPLIRVPQGTRVRVRLRNRLVDSTFIVDGLGPSPRGGDLIVGPREVVETEFTADAAGTRIYAVRPNPEAPKNGPEISQLAGAIVVDAPGARTDDRVLVMNIWSEQRPDSTWREALAINGKSWPHTERFDLTVGDSVRWRVVNASPRGHPMHLHGAYFRVDARGDLRADTIYTAAAQRLAVTEDMDPLTTMQIAWSPDEPGNWLFHCHLSFHVSAEARLQPPADHHAANASVDINEHMAGLVMGIAVRPRAGEARPPRGPARRLGVYVLSSPAADTSRPPSISFLGARVGREPTAAEVRVPGEMLLLTRGEPTDVTVHNRLSESIAIHWHGLELESYSDGVPGWSGVGAQVAPAIAPRDSFTARLSLRRAGTFIYHTHLNDIAQLSAGLYGALIVLEPGERWDPSRDHVFVGGWNSAVGDGVFVVNGGASEPPLALRVGTRYRLRFINIAPAALVTYKIERAGVLEEWELMAKDGADLPAHQRQRGPAAKRIAVGETFDVYFTPSAPGTFTLAADRGRVAQRVYSRQLVVRR